MLDWLSDDIGIDLGTANTLVFVRKKGIVLSEPSVVALYKDTRKVRAVGLQAKSMLGRTPANTEALRPLKDGVIADFEVTEAMLRYFIGKVTRHIRLMPPRVVVAVPSGITEVERRAVKESAIHAGAREVVLLEEPMAAAIGVGLPISEPDACMIVDVGGGTTEVAIITLGGVVFTKSLRVGGDEMDMAIIHYMKRAYNLVIGERTAEHIKLTVGSAWQLEEELKMDVRGRDAVAGLPRTLEVSSKEIREALEDVYVSIIDIIRSALERCPPELSADLVTRGIVLAGGGALVRGLDKKISEDTDLPVVVAPNSLGAVAEGTGVYLENFSSRLGGAS